MKQRVFVIEDNSDVLEMIEWIMIGEGYTVIPVSSIKEYYQKRDYQPDLILLDEWLPDGYGHELCSQLKSDPLTSSIPIILVSAFDDISALAKQCNADSYIKKPFNIDQLSNVVNMNINKHRLTA